MFSILFLIFCITVLTPYHSTAKATTTIRVITCKLSHEFFDVDEYVEEFIESIKQNDDLKIVSEFDDIISTGIKLIKFYFFQQEESKEQQEDIESCFFLEEDGDIEYRIVPDMEGLGENEEVVNTFLEAAGLGSVIKYINFINILTDEEENAKYCNTTYDTLYENTVKVIACSAYNFLKKWVYNNVTMSETNQLFEIVDSKEGTFRPRREISEKTMQFQMEHTQELPELKFDFGISNSTKLKLLGMVDNIKIIFNNLGKLFKGKTLYIPTKEINDLLLPKLKEIKFQVDTGVRELKEKAFLIKNSNFSNYNPNIISICKQKSNNQNEGQVCLKNTNQIKNFDANGEPIWTGPGPTENNEWDLGFINFLKSTWNFIVDIWGLLVQNCLSENRDPSQCKYCLWLDGFWDSINNCMYPYFVGVLDWVGWLFGMPEFDPMNPGCNKYSTYSGYFVGIWKLLNFLNPLIEYPPGLHWCLIWNSFIILFPLAIITPILIVISVSLVCLILNCRGTLMGIRDDQLIDDHETEITGNNKISNRLIRRIINLEENVAKQNKKINDQKIELLNMNIATQNFLENRISM